MRKILYIFGVLNDSDVDWIAQVGVRRNISRNEILIRQGEPTNFIALLLEGKASVSVNGIGEVATLTSGDLMGEMSLVDSVPPSATVAALSDCSALFLEKSVVVRKTETDVAFGFRFFRALSIVLADRLRGLEGRMSYARGAALDSDTHMQDEIDIGVLDNISMAGDRFDRMLKAIQPS
jgi:CRP-like cAMP-binding protein